MAIVDLPLGKSIGIFLGVFTGYDPKGTGESCVFILGGEREEDIEMLQYMTDSIKAQIHNLTEDFRERTNASSTDTNAYRLGVVQRVEEKLQSMAENVSDRQSQKALVLKENKEKQRKSRQAAEEAEQVRFVKGSGASYRSEHTRRQGKKDGDKVNVNKGTPSPDSKRQITS